MADPTFRRRVLAAVSRIPPGRVATYGDVAAAAGNARACRAVGNIMRECRAPGIPCHRVIAAGGKLGGFGSSLQLKRELLRAEGVLVSSDRIREFAERRWARPERSRGAGPERSRGARPEQSRGAPREARPSQRSRRRATRQADGDV